MKLCKNVELFEIRCIFKRENASIKSDMNTIYMLLFHFEELDDIIDFDHFKLNNLKILDHPLT